MKAGIGLVAGDTCQTLGYYSVNDGGAGLYKIVNDTSIVADDAFYIQLSNNLLAKLIVYNNEVNFKQLGARPQDINTNERYDVASYFNLFMDYLKNNLDCNYNLYIPSGIWTTTCVTFALNAYQAFDIRGDYNFYHSNLNYSYGTLITPYEDNQTNIFVFGKATIPWHNFKIKDGLSFSSFGYTYTNKKAKDNGTRYTVTDSLVSFYRCSYGNIDFLNFQYFGGTAFKIANSWEIYWSYLNIRDGYNYTDNGIIVFGTKDSSISGSNLSALHFEYIMIENIGGSDLIEIQPSSSVLNSDIGTLNVEASLQYIPSKDSYSTDFTDFDETSAIHNSVINIKGGSRSYYKHYYYE